MHTIRKLLAVVCSLCMYLTSYAQADSVSAEGILENYTAYMDNIMQHLDKSRVPYGILYDRVFPFARLADTASGDTTSLADFIQAYSEWQRADYTFEHNDTIFDHTTIANFIRGQNELDTIPILVFNADFASIDSAAFTDGRIDTLAGLMYDGENTALPYQTHHEVFAVLGLNRIPDSGKTYYFVFDQFYEFGNHPYHVIEVKLKDLSSGEEYSFTPGGIREVAITLTGEGGRHFKLTTTIEEGSPGVINTNLVPELWKPTYVADENCESTGTYTSWLGFQGYDEPTTRNGNFNYKIYYGRLPNGQCRGYLEKPIIITDGYDVGNETKFKDIYDDYLSYNYNYNYSKVSFGDQLRNLGYDIIIIDFPNEIIGWEQKIRLSGITPRIETVPVFWDHGCDYIERNGLAVACFIDYVNGMLLANDITDEQLVVVGPSMGGQITRYALKYMEDHNWYHNTRLWISFDSPHLGANIPFGFQEMMRFMSQNLGIEKANDMYKGNLRSPAARQMLIHQTNPDMSAPIPATSQNFAIKRFLNTNDAEPLRTSWINTLNSIGFPSNLRKIAIANGKFSGGDFHIPGSKMFAMKSKSVKNGVKAFEAGPYLTAPYTSTLVDVWKWGSGDLYKLAGNLNCTYGALDACPGGMYDVQQVFYDVVHGSIDKVNGHPIFHKVHNTVEQMSHNISFIPTVSALSLASHNWPWVNSFNPQNVNCNYECPFDNIYVPEYNQNHVSLTEESARWVIQEIVDSKYPYSCPRVCISEITGDTYLPLSGTKTYGLNGSIPGSSTVSWSLGSDLSASSTSGSSINITRIANTGNDGVNVHVNNDCSADIYLYKKLSATPKPGRPGDDNSQNNGPQNTTTGIYIYPNPATDHWNVEIAQPSQNISATLTDISGRKVWSTQATAPCTLRIASKALAPGLYTLHLGADGKETYHKLIK